MNLNIDFSKVETQPKEYIDLTPPSTPVTPSSTIGSLALNLEAVATLEENKEELSEFTISESDISRLVAAIGAGVATESVINARILNEALTTEGRGLIKTVVRKGKLVKKVICPEGFTSKNGLCIRMTSRDLVAYKKRAMKAARTRARHAPKAGAARMRARSLLIRGKNAAKVNRIMAAPPPSFK